MRIGIFGGTFDPIHLGHLRMAEEIRDSLSLERVLFIPNQVSPFKTNRNVTPAERRMEMVWQAVADNPAFAVSAAEVRRPGPSYTVDTVRELRRDYPEDELFLLIGSDAVRDLPQWRAPEELLSQVRIAVATRPGTDPAEVLAALPDTWEPRLTFIPMPGLDISGTDLRARVRARRSITYLVPRAVETYIARHGLYAAEERGKEIS